MKIQKIFLCLTILLFLVNFPVNLFATDINTSRQIGQRGSNRLVHPISKKINFVYSVNRKTPNPQGWEAYDGSIYNPSRGYGWLTDLAGKGRDRGGNAAILLADKTITSPGEIGRLELANWQGGNEAYPLVFRIDLPDGWYNVSCSSVDPGTVLPVIDKRSFKCRSKDVVFAGANYGSPQLVKGMALVEGDGNVEVSGGHLRIVVGDVAYGGWTWKYQGPWYKGWIRWWGNEHNYANGWLQKLSRRVDPGWHMSRLNSLEVRQLEAPANKTTPVFCDYFDRDNSPNINSGVALKNQWVMMNARQKSSEPMRIDLYQTSIRFSENKDVPSEARLIQKQLSPETGTIRYSTRVSLFSGEGSKMGKGAQEAGIVLLANTYEPGKFDGSFVGVALDDSRSESMGWIRYTVGDGKGGYRTNIWIPDNSLPINITAGEFEIIVEHDLARDLFRKIEVNGVDITNRIEILDLKQVNKRGQFGIHSMMNEGNSGVKLKQFFWYFRVEKVS